jgi:aspartate/glutamate racemase
MAPRIVLIHALGESGPAISQAFADAWPDARLVNLLDDSLSVDRRDEGELSDNMIDRFQTLTDYAVGTGAEAILFTCSAFHEAIYKARANLDIPVLTPDEAMMERALEFARSESGPRITMLATFAPTLATATAAMEAIAAAAGKSVQVNAVHVEGALEALQGGDAATHERLIVQCAAALPETDVILLAQFTMASSAPAVAAAVTCPVLTSPTTSVAKLKHLLD